MAFNPDPAQGAARSAAAQGRTIAQQNGTWVKGGAYNLDGTRQQEINSHPLLTADPLFGNLAKGEALAKRQADFGYGANNSAEANQALGRADQIGQEYGGAFGDLASQNAQRSEDAGARGTGMYRGDTLRYDQGLANAADARVKQGGSYDALMGFANQGPGPSAAQAQLTQATNANTANTLALARSGRGLGGGQAAMRQALAQNAGTQQQSAAQMAELRANENTAYQAQRLNALNAGGGLASQIAGTDQGYAQQGLAGAQYTTDTKLKGTQLNDASAQNWATQQANATQQGLGAEMGAETQKQNINATALAGRENEYASANSTYATEKGLAQAASIADANRQQAYTGAALSTAGTVIGSLSDERAKKNIRPLSTWGTGDDDPVIADAFAQGLKAGASGLAPGKVRSTWGTGDDEDASVIIDRAKRENRGRAPAAMIKEPAGSRFDPIAHSDMIRGEDQPYTFGDTQGRAEYWMPSQRTNGPHASINPANNPYLLSDERSKQDVNPLGTPATPTPGMVGGSLSPTEPPHDGSVAGKVGGPSLAEQQAVKDEKAGQTGQTAGKVAGSVVGSALLGPVGGVAGNLIGGAIGKGLGKLFSDVRGKEAIVPLADSTKAVSEYTALKPGDQKGFDSWIKKNNVNDLDNPDSHYDYRGAYLAGEGRGADSGHFTDRFKQHGHPTFSTESQYSKGPKDGGDWIGDTYLPEAPQGRGQATARRFARSDHPILSEGDSLNGGPLAEASRQIPGYAYDYKDPQAPGAKPGRQVGPMAQDLAANPLTRGTVIKDRKGKLGVDTPRLTLYNTAAQHAQQNQIDDLNSKIDSLTGLLKRKPGDEQTNYGGLRTGTGGL